MTAKDFLAVLAEATGDSQPLSAGEQQYLTAHTDMTDEDLEPGSDRAKAARFAVASGQAVEDRHLRRSALTTNEVAELLGQAPSHVCRSHLRGGLYAVEDGRVNLFPRWQFTENGRVVSCLRRIMGLFPDDFHPLDVAAVMTSPPDQLGGTSPADWLAGGGQVESVADLIDALKTTDDPAQESQDPVHSPDRRTR